jgi:hypothetical protein
VPGPGGEPAPGLVERERRGAFEEEFGHLTILGIEGAAHRPLSASDVGLCPGMCMNRLVVRVWDEVMWLLATTQVMAESEEKAP